MWRKGERMLALGPQAIGKMVKNSLWILQETDLIRSSSSRKKPSIILESDVSAPYGFTDCLLLKSMKSPRECRRMAKVCRECSFFECPAHPNESGRARSERDPFVEKSQYPAILSTFVLPKLLGRLLLFLEKLAFVRVLEIPLTKRVGHL